MLGVCVNWVEENPKKLYGIIEGSDGCSYHVRSSDVAPDSIGRKFLSDHEPVDFDPMQSQTGLLFAVNVVRLEPFVLTPKEVSLHREEITIYEITNGAFGARKIGSLYVTPRVVVALALKIGDRFTCGVRPPFNPALCWIATAVRRVPPTEPQ